MALSPEDKYRFALRVIGFACTTFYVFIYGAAPESKQCIRIHPAALHETATRYPYAIAATARSTPSPRPAGDRYFFDGKAGYAWSPAHYDEQGNTTLEFEGMVIWSYFGLGVQLMRASFDENLDRAAYLGSRRISASRGAAAVRGGRATSFPGMTAVGGFFFVFGPIRARCGVPRGARPWRGEERCWRCRHLRDSNN